VPKAARIVNAAMKIVQAVGWYHPDSLGGTEIYVAALARHFRGCGHQVLVAAPEAGAQAPRTYDVDGCEVFRYPVPAAPTREEAQGETAVRGSEHFHRWLHGAHADVVHFHTFVTGLGLPEIVAARQAGSRVFATTHSSSLGFLCQRGTLMRQGRAICDGIVDARGCAECELEHRGASPFVARALSAIPPQLGGLARGLPGRAGTALAMTDLIVRNDKRQSAMLDAVDGFCLLTQRAADIVVANGAPSAKVIVNRLGVSESPASNSQPSPTRVNRDRSQVRVGYVGRFDPIKGVLDLAHAVRRIPRDVPLCVEFLGPAQTPGDRATRAAVLELLEGDSRATIAEAVPPSAVHDVLSTYDVLCCPSRCLEGGPTSGLEALASGIPVIAASAGGLAEVLEDGVNTRLVPPGDVECLTAALVDVARHPEQTIDRWRERLPVPRTMRDVAHDYLDLYVSRH
jgi:glycosyltransferase involved in cell wall biosynthesis